MGRSKRKSFREDESADPNHEDGTQYTYQLMPDTRSPFSCCCIAYRYLLDMCLVLALSPFIINCFLEAIIYLVKFDWGNMTWGKVILMLIVETIWFAIGIFGVVCCIAVVRKGVFTRRLRQKRRDQTDAGFLEEDSMV